MRTLARDAAALLHFFANSEKNVIKAMPTLHLYEQYNILLDDFNSVKLYICKPINTVHIRTFSNGDSAARGRLLFLLHFFDS